MLWGLTIISLIALCNTQLFTPTGETSQSSNFDYLTSEKAVDGNETDCAHTLELPNSWWRIDLLNVYKISAIAIYNKEHHNSYITGACIHIGNSRENNGTTNSLCKNITTFTQNNWNTFQCNAVMSGRYISVFFPKTMPSVLCEVKINGTQQESPFVLIKENKTWEDALNHCRKTNMDLVTILDKDTQALAELAAREADTPFVWLALHYSCTLDFWFWVTDHGLEFDRRAPTFETGACDTSGAMDKNEDHLWFKHCDNETFNFICAK